MASELADRLLPDFQFSEYHKCICQASAIDSFRGVQQINMADSFIIKALFILRGLPTSDLHFKAFLRNMNFTYLDESVPEELVVGYWIKPGSKGPVTISNKAHFIQEESPWTQKVIWNFNFEALGDNETRISTETRVWCLSDKNRRLFSLYWFFIRPFSGLIRKQILRIAQKNAKTKK